ncbi:MAG: hypothetical protein JJT95_06060 [Pararhodobacter sp.]|nr:hypothetical protein [Pararhodobacter sp.]
MAEYFYTLDLGSIYGAKLERLAAFTSHDDREAFAAMLLARAIDEMETWMHAELYAAFEEDITALREKYKIRNETHLKNRKIENETSEVDDGIPF